MPQIITKSTKAKKLAEDNQPRLAHVSLWTYEHDQVARTMHRHHNQCEVLLTVEGHGLHMVGGETLHTKRGDVLVYNTGVVHEDSAQADSMEHIYCCGVENLRITGLPENCLLPRGASALLHTGSRFDEFEAMFRMIYVHATEPRPHSEEIIAHLLPALLLMITQLGYEEQMGEQPESAQVNLMREYIDTHYAEDISLEHVATQAGISPYYASHLFKEFSGYSPMQYVMRRRISEAQSLLLTTKLPIADIAGQIGFDSPNHFSTIFSKHTGYAPSIYRKQFLQTTQ